MKGKQTIETIWKGMEGRKGMKGRKGRKGMKGMEGRKGIKGMKGRKGTVHKLEFLRQFIVRTVRQNFT